MRIVLSLHPRPHAAAMLQIGAHLRKLRHIRGRAADQKGGVVDQQAGDPPRLRLDEQRPDLADVQMTGREDRVIFRDQVEDRQHLLLEPSAIVDDGEHRRLKHLLLCRQELLAMRMADMVRRREGRHPDEARTELEAMLDCIGIEAAGRVVARDPGQQPDLARHDLVEQGRDGGDRIIMVLEQDRAQPRRFAFPDRLHMVEPARHDRRAAMAVQVDRAFQQFGDAVAHSAPSLGLGMG